MGVGESNHGCPEIKFIPYRLYFYSEISQILERCKYDAQYSNKYYDIFI